jgi:C-terminal processing protease CtpA/Prc
MQRRLFLVPLVVPALGLWFAAAGLAAPPRQPVNLDLEDGELGKVPTGWSFPKASQEAGYTARLTDANPHRGKRCVVLSRDPKAATPGVGNLSQVVLAADYRGKRIRLRAAVRAEVSGYGDQAQLWLRVQRANGKTAFHAATDRPIVTKEWGTYEVAAEVAADAEQVSFGMMLRGKGKAWLDSVSLEVVGKAGEGNEAARPLTRRGLENLVAFTRLLGYVRYFHPSDQAAAADWDTFTIEAVGVVEKAKDPAELIQALERLFRPIAPTVRVFPTGKRPEIPAELAPPKGVKSPKVLVWRHIGVGTGQPWSVYRSMRVDSRETAKIGSRELEKPEPPPQPGKPLQADLGAGVSCLVPLALYADAKGTLPHGPKVRPAAPAKPKGFLPTGNDRATRLADIALAWNVFQHFYPYFDVVKTDWPATLRRALAEAAKDRDEAAFLQTLRRLVADLHDGHGHVFHPAHGDSVGPPFVARWVENRLIVTHVVPKAGIELKRGEEILTVDGRPAADLLRARERLISGATAQYKRYRALRELFLGPQDSAIKLEVQPPSGKRRTVTVRRSHPGLEVTEPRPPKVHEVKPGILYVDLDRITDADFQKALPRLAKAKGIIFDLRGYPRAVSPTTIGHLIDKPVTSARWHIPVTLYPDRQKVAFTFSNWEVKPQKPRLKAKVTFITDGRAISYAETYTGIIEHYHLATFVGEATAGTNGNVNPFSLPGGFRVMWTGMKVLKHDGSQHHGVGIRPTVPVARTRRGVTDGRDEFLDKAIELVSR